jgi:uncharacterized paraquat-inducible protein A
MTGSTPSIRRVVPPYLRQRLQMVVWVMPMIAFATIALNLLGRWAGITPIGGHPVILLVMVLTTIGGTHVVQRWIRRRITREVAEARGQLCPQCGYALQDPAHGPACPECGLHITPAEARQAWLAAGFNWPEAESPPVPAA